MEHMNLTNVVGVLVTPAVNNMVIIQVVIALIIRVKNMTISFFRVIRKNGDSLGVTIPNELIKKEGLQDGSRVWVILRK